MANEAFSEFRPKIASLQNLVMVKYETESRGARQHARDGWRFREALESQKKENTPLFPLVPSDDLKYLDKLCHFLNVSFQGFVL
jgi:hypothetical protein